MMKLMSATAEQNLLQASSQRRISDFDVTGETWLHHSSRTTLVFGDYVHSSRRHKHT